MFIVAAGGGGDRGGYPRILLRGWIVLIPERIWMWMGEPFLECRRRCPNQGIKGLECGARLEPPPVCRRPERVVAEDLVLKRAPIGKQQPLNIVGIKDVAGHWKIDTRVRGCDRHNRGQMRWKRSSRCPLVIPGVRPAPHGDLATAIGLLRNPLDHVVSVLALLKEGTKLSFRVASTSHIDGHERKTVCSKIHPALVIGLRDIRRKRHDARCWLPLRLGDVHVRAKTDAVTQRNPDVPVKLNASGVRKRRIVASCQRNDGLSCSRDADNRLQQNRAHSPPLLPQNIRVSGRTSGASPARRNAMQVRWLLPIE